jgi:hypothetical protein
MSEYGFSREIQAALQTPVEKPIRRYSTFWPFFIVLLTLIFSTTRDGLTLYKRTLVIRNQNAQQEEPLKKAGEQAQLFDSLKLDLEKLAPDDRVAARIVHDFFPPPPPPPAPEPFPVAPPKPITPTFRPFTAPEKSANPSPNPNGASKTPPPSKA